MALASGTRLGVFEIVGTLGAGGMGEVYRARDTRLGRMVAIKVLPESMAADPAARSRFVREGQTLAALSHPNLVALYDVGTEGDTTYAVMELVEGETIAAKLATGRLPMRRVTDYAVQIASGLTAAHDKGIVHRDLKPANIIVASDGHVKILDFGLAKADALAPMGANRTSDAETAIGTNAGVVLGTVGYMAPEQVRGLPAEARADIFSFGAVLYEMAAGKRAFDRASAAETMSAIVNDEPAPMPPDRDVPAALDRIIRRCLEKRPEDRFRSAADLAFQLETLSSPTARVETPAPAPLLPRRRIGIVAAAAIFVAGLAAGWVVLGQAWPLPSGRTAASVPRLTTMTYSGRDRSPATSPDGRTLAFASGRDGVSRIWLRQLATGEEAPLTEGMDREPRFSPDGATVLFARYEGGSSSLYRVPSVGGQPRKVLEQAMEGDWSPDGTRLAFVRQRKDGSWTAGVAAADGSQVRENSTSVTTSLKGPRWSPDGRSFVIVQSGIQATIQDRLLVFDAATLASTVVEAIESGGQVSTPAWTADGDLLYAQSPDVTSYNPESRIVQQHVRGGGSIVAWIPSVSGGTVELLADGSVVLDTASTRHNLREFEWTPAGLTAGRWLTRGTSTDRQPAYSPDGKWIVFSSTRNGNLDLWITSPESGAARRLTDDKTEDWDPGFTPDGKGLLWSSNRSGHFEIWIAEPDARNARQLTKDGVDAENPTATPDGEWIVYGAGSEPTQGVWKIRRDGSQATRLTHGPGAHPDLSPDGQYILFHTNVVGRSQVQVVQTADGKQAMPPIALASTEQLRAVVSVGRGRWRPDGRAILFLGADANGAACLYEQAFVPGQDTSATRRILQRSETTQVVESFGASPDGKRITISFVEDQWALMRLEGLAGVTRPRR